MVFGAMAAGGAVALVVAAARGWSWDALLIAAAPAALLALIQKIDGHVVAWRRGGVEQAFVMKSAAISFYVMGGIAMLLGIAMMAGDIHLSPVWLLIGPLWIDTVVRKSIEHRYA